MTEETIEQATTAALARMGATFSATGGQRTKRDTWDCYAWRVTFKRGDGPRRTLVLDTDYFCGLAHVVPLTPTQKRREQNWPGSFDPKPLAPSAAGVLSSLLHDAGALSESFNDWCSNCGYDNDSIKAFNAYQLCCDNGRKLRQLFTGAELTEFMGLLEDY